MPKTTNLPSLRPKLSRSITAHPTLFQIKSKYTKIVKPQEIVVKAHVSIILLSLMTISSKLSNFISLNRGPCSHDETGSHVSICIPFILVPATLEAKNEERDSQRPEDSVSMKLWGSVGKFFRCFVFAWFVLFKNIFVFWCVLEIRFVRIYNDDRVHNAVLVCDDEWSWSW